jgi:hypothetical protein
MPGGGVGRSLGRETIYKAFFDQIAASPFLLAPNGPFYVITRRPLTLMAGGECQYPMLQMREAGEIYDRTVLKAPARVTLLVQMVIQCIIEFDGDLVVTQLNNLADAVEAAIQSACDVTAQNTLTGLVQEAWINHRAQITLPSQASRVAEQVIMVEIVLPHSR